MGWDLASWLRGEPRKDTMSLLKEAEALAVELAGEWAERARRMPEQDPDSSDLLHMPVYDCASDLFELPCESRPTELAGTGLEEHFRGWADAEARLRTKVAIGRRSLALVDGESFIDLLHAPTPEPGASIARLIRVGADAWVLVRWRAGMSPAAAALDPAFQVPEVAAEPSLWLAREIQTLGLWKTEPAWVAAYRRCTHRPVC